MTVCNIDTNVVQIEFLEQFGALSPLVPRIDSTMEISGGMVYISGDGETCFNDKDDVVYQSRKGTKEADPCAGRGICSTDEGMCYCFDTNGDEYFSSDGYGGPGDRGDCGYDTSSSAFLYSYAIDILRPIRLVHALVIFNAPVMVSVIRMVVPFVVLAPMVGLVEIAQKESVQLAYLGHHIQQKIMLVIINILSVQIWDYVINLLELVNVNLHFMAKHVNIWLVVGD